MMSRAMQNVSRVAILDAGAQYGKVIDRRCRELKVDTVMVPLSTTVVEIKRLKCNAIIISGGPGSVNASTPLNFDENLFSCGLPVLGICYGLQVMCKAFGGRVTHFDRRHDGPTLVEIDPTCALFAGLSRQEEVMLTHGDTVEIVPEKFKPVSFCGGLVMAVANEAERLYGVQFHPEVDLTVHGRQMLVNFLHKIAHMEPNFTLENREETMIKEIQEAVGDKTVIMLLSGGVDSTVAAALLARALPPGQIYAVHIDHGFMREKESEDVVKSLVAMNLAVKLIDASRFFTLSRLNAAASGDATKPDGDMLCNVIDPEEKRKIIGDAFTKTIQKEVEDQLGMGEDEVLLGQGTLRPDLIESASPSASSHAQIIKTHHNDTYLIRQLRDRNRVIEPLKDFHKDEVRQLGKSLGLPAHIIDRHPFPGPGLAIRILCATGPYACKDFYKINTLLETMCRYNVWRQYAEQATRFLRDSLSSDDRIMLNQLTKTYHFRTILLPVRSVGVQGDERSYSYVAAIAMEDADDEDAHPESLFDKFSAAEDAEAAAADGGGDTESGAKLSVTPTPASVAPPVGSNKTVRPLRRTISDEDMQTDENNSPNGVLPANATTVITPASIRAPISNMSISPTPPPLDIDNDDASVPGSGAAQQPPKKARNGDSLESNRMDVDAAAHNVRTPTSASSPTQLYMAAANNNNSATPQPSYKTPLDALMHREKQLLIDRRQKCADEDKMTEEVEKILERDREAKTIVPWHALSKLTFLITQVNHSINRVVFIFDGFDKSITNLIQQQVTPTKLRAETIKKIRTADKIATNVLRSANCMAKVAQMPVILLPLQFDPVDETLMFPSRHSVVLRPFITNDFMTGRAALPGKDLPEDVVFNMAKQIRDNTPGVSRVLYDLTNKPPGTTEWE